jgi:hypothetical protein
MRARAKAIDMLAGSHASVREHALATTSHHLERARPIATHRRQRSRATRRLERLRCRDHDGTCVANGAAGSNEENDMGTAQNQNGNVDQQQSGQQQNMQGGAQGQSVGSPITNEAYNVISALASKLEGLEAYRKYCKDGSGQIWQQLTQIEVQGVQKLVDELETLVKAGKLRMGTPGKANG